MKTTGCLVVLTMLLLLTAGRALAHTALCSCYGNGDGTITCEGGFSDGSSAAGVEMRVVDMSGKALVTGKINADNEFSFKRPDVPFKVQFDAGEGHLVEVAGKDITD